MVKIKIKYLANLFLSKVIESIRRVLMGIRFGVFRADENIGCKPVSLMPKANKNAKLICNAIAEAERILGNPPNLLELVAVFHHNYGTAITKTEITMFVEHLYREDLFYQDSQCCYRSLTGPDGSEARKSYELFSERFLRLYPGYILNKHMRIEAKPTTPVINLN